MDKISGIYKIINKVNGKYYIGSSYRICVRWNRHKNLLFKNKHENEHLQRAWNKYGGENFEFVIIEENIPKIELLMIEQKYLDIAKLDRENCYNMSFIAGKIEMTKEINNKISKSLTNYYSSHENHMKNKKLSNERIQKMKQCHNKYGSCYDSKIYKFYNKLTQEKFIGRRADFVNKYGLHRGAIHELIHKQGRRKSYKNWVLL
jgi:group I intron endonuclease